MHWASCGPIWDDMVKRRIRLHSDTAGTPNFDTALVTELGAVTRRVDGLRAALEQAERKQKLLQELAALEKPTRATAEMEEPQEIASEWHRHSGVA